MWIKELKIALIEENVSKINSLMQSIPTLDDARERDQALVLIQECKKLLLHLQGETQKAMIQIQKNLKFLHTTQVVHANKFDIIS